ncbi:MAG: hypothetical protein II253_01295, partial [Lachnospiraceae bacterium]|nr:hypothetical protein [Lachnospiraceae bacterium]
MGYFPVPEPVQALAHYDPDHLIDDHHFHSALLEDVLHDFDSQVDLAVAAVPDSAAVAAADSAADHYL